MSIYKSKATGEEIVVCDGCGISERGTKLDPEWWEKVDFTAKMLKDGFPEGTALDVRDWCPDCGAPSP
jgi:hypothetical protein